MTTAAQDTVTQLVAAIRKVARVVPGAAAVIGPMRSLDYAKAGKPDIDWDDLQARQDLVSDLVNDALAVLAELAGADAPEREAAAADALGLLVLRAAVPGGFTLDDFAIDEHAGTVMAPALERRPGHRHSDTPTRSQTGIQRSIRRDKRLTPKHECVGVSLPPTQCSYGRDAEE